MQNTGGQGAADATLDRWLRIAAPMAFAAAVLVTSASILNYAVADDSVTVLNAGEEATVNNWLTVVASFGAGLAALLLVSFVPERRRALLTVAAIFAVISLDDMLLLHERVGDNVGISHIETAIFAPLFAYAFFLTWRLAAAFDRPVARLVRTGLILLAIAIAIDLGSSYTQDLAKEGTEWPQPVRIAIEEGFEVAGWVLLAGVLLSLFARSLLAAWPKRPDERADPDEPSLWRRVALLALVASAAITFGALLNHFALDDRIPDLNVELETSLNNWITVVASFTAALGAALYAEIQPERRRMFLALAVAFLLLSLDDQIRIRERVDSDVIETFALAPIYGTAFVLAWLSAPGLEGRAAARMRAGLGLLVVAIALDLTTPITHSLEDDGLTSPQAIRVAVEEGFEIGGWILIAAAVTWPVIRRWWAKERARRRFIGNDGARGEATG